MKVPGKVPPFIRSIPIEKALDGDTLIATHMNGAALTKHHGFPARALVPGWIGAAPANGSLRLKCSTRNSWAIYESRLPLAQPTGEAGDAVKPEDTHAMTSLTVKSVIAGPSDGAKLKAGKVTCRARRGREKPIS